MPTQYIPVDAFSCSYLIIFHLYVDAFPEVFPQFYHTLQTRAASRDSTFRLLPWLVTASGCLRLLCAEAQGCPHYIAAEAASIQSFQQSTRLSSAAAATPRRTWNERKAGHRRTFSSGFWFPAALVWGSVAFSRIAFGNNSISAFKQFEKHVFALHSKWQYWSIENFIKFSLHGSISDHRFPSRVTH